VSHGVTVICNNFPLCWELDEIIGMGLIFFFKKKINHHLS
jgi:hypothetical protein